MTVEEAFRVLGLERGATKADVRRAYRLAVLRLHPDRARGRGLSRPKEFLKVRDAYELLREADFTAQPEPEPEPERPRLGTRRYQAPSWLVARWERSGYSLGELFDLDEEEATFLKRLLLIFLCLAVCGWAAVRFTRRARGNIAPQGGWFFLK